MGVGDIVSGGIGLVGSLGGKGGKNDANKEALKNLYYQQLLQNDQTQQAAANALWTKDQNAAELNMLNEGNRASQSNNFGGIDWSRDAATGNWNQVGSLNPAVAGNVDATRGQQAGLIQQLGPQQFDANNAVVQALRGLQAPGLQQQRASKEAQLAAMGMGVGSGDASSRVQRELNDSENQADLLAILRGFDASQALGQANRANFNALGDYESKARQNMVQPGYAPLVANTVGNLGLPGQPSYGLATQQGNLVAGQNQQNQAGLLNVLSKTGQAIGNWWDTPSTSSSGGGLGNGITGSIWS